MGSDLAVMMGLGEWVVSRFSRPKPTALSNLVDASKLVHIGRLAGGGSEEVTVMVRFIVCTKD